MYIYDFCGEHFLRENPVWRVCGILRDFSANILGDTCEKIKLPSSTVKLVFQETSGKEIKQRKKFRAILKNAMFS